MRFDLQPWDRNRPRRNPPLADAVVSHGGKTFGLRAQNGILFFRQASDGGKTWAIGSPLPGEIEGNVAAYEAFWAGEYVKGNVARVVVPVVMLHLFNKRQIPLFLKGDGTGFARESWNRDDIPFSHDVSRHSWLEGSDEVLLREVKSVEDFLENELAQLEFPSETAGDDEDEGIEWACGSMDELRRVVGWIGALEPVFWEGDARAVKIDILAENAFARAYVWRIDFVPDRDIAGELRLEVAPNSDQLEWVAQHIYIPQDDGSSLVEPQTEPPFLPSGRFFRLLDVAIDANTPLGLFWAYTDQGAGRCADAPHAPCISFEIARPDAEGIERAREALRRWLQSAVPRAEVEEILGDDAPRELPKHDWFSF